MEQKRLKNFIAFTLSEMMIVMLIISVLSAVTLPSILTRKSTKNIDVDSTWQYDYKYTFGNYYNGNNSNTQVLIGSDITELNDTDRSNDINNFGNAAVSLRRNNMLSYVNEKKSDIALYNKNGDYEGRIAADGYGNMVIGKNSGEYTSDESYNNIYIGSVSSQSQNAYSMSEPTYGNTVIGNNTLKSAYWNENNVVIGNDIGETNLYKNNVVIGNGATYKTLFDNSIDSLYHENNISIGNYASAESPYHVSSIDIGYRAGANQANRNSTNGDSGFSNFINIGYYASYYSNSNAAGYSSINLGHWAGANNFYASANNPYRIDNLSVGNYAGFASFTDLNVGTFSGYNANNGNEYHQNVINIGQYAGSTSSSTSMTGINIGPYTGNNKGYYPQVDGINIGYYASSRRNNIAGHSAYSYLTETAGSNSVNIGSFSGSDSFNHASVNIGLRAGYEPREILVPNTKYYNVHIGSNETSSNEENSSQSYNNVVIGCSGLVLNANHRMCIGGKYPLTGSINNAWDTDGTTIPAATLITTPGILGASNVAWNKTKILLYSRYLISYETTMNTFSDKTLKENIKKTTYGINKLRKVLVREFNMKGSKTPNIGVIAQELMKEYPNAVIETTNPINGKKILNVSPDWIIFSMVQALKDVDLAALNLQKELRENKLIVAKDSKKLDSIEHKLSKLSKSNQKLQEQLEEIDKMIAVTEKK